MRPALHEASAHRTVALDGVEFAYRLEGANTDGGAAVLEVTIPPRTLVKPHQHSREDEFSLILSGVSEPESAMRRMRRSMPGRPSSSRATFRTQCGTSPTKPLAFSRS
jgi:hypothetical protein